MFLIPFLILFVIFSFNLIFSSFNLNQLFLLNGLFDFYDTEQWYSFIMIPFGLPYSMALDLFFFFLISLVIVSSYCMLSFKKLMNSLIHLILIFIIMGLLLLLLNFDFLAVLTLLIYVGAIMVFFLFAILLLLKFFSFKVVTIAKNKLITRFDYLLLLYFFVTLVVFCYSLFFESIEVSEDFYHCITFGFIERSYDLCWDVLNPFLYVPSLFLAFIFLLKFEYIEECFFFDHHAGDTNLEFLEFLELETLYQDVSLSNLAINLSELDLIHVYGLQLYIYYSFLIISAAILLSLVIFAALKISKPFKSILISKYLYK